MRHTAFPAAALLVLMSGSGCQIVNPSVLSRFGLGERPDRTVSTGGYSYTGGHAVQTLALPPATVKAAVALALEDLRIDNVREKPLAGAIRFEGLTTDKRRAYVTIRPHPVGTRLSARIGAFGDEPMTRFLVDRVGIRLGMLPPAPVPEEPPSAAASNPYFSRGAVSDSVMLKEQADAVYRGTSVP
jgi:hypothetical protein